MKLGVLSVSSGLGEEQPSEARRVDLFRTRLPVLSAQPRINSIDTSTELHFLQLTTVGA